MIIHRKNSANTRRYNSLERISILLFWFRCNRSLKTLNKVVIETASSFFWYVYYLSKWGRGGGKGIYSRRVFGLWLKGCSLIHGREVIGTWALIWGDMVHLRRTLPLTSLSFCHTMRFLRRKKSLRNRTTLEKDCPLKYNVVLCVLLFYFGYVCLFVSLFSR